MIQLLIFLLTTSDVSYIHDKNFDFSYNIFLILFDTPIRKMEVIWGTRGHFNIVLSAKFCGTPHVVARFQGVPQKPHFCRSRGP
jgi:hypothetical protein